MKALVICALLLASPAFGKSIFDEDAPPAVSAPSPRGSQPTPAPTPAPEPAAPEPAPSPATPAPAPTGSAASADSPASPSAAIPARPATLEELGARARDAIRQARESALLYFQRAKTEAESNLEADSDYLRARSETQAAKAHLEEVRLHGSGEEILAASTTYAADVRREKSLREVALGANAAYSEAKSLEERFAPANAAPASAPMAVAVAAPSASEAAEWRREVADAIASHNLILGMTYEAACRSALAQGQFVRRDGSSVIYHWVIRKQTGTHQEISESHRTALGFRNIYVTVADYQVVGYVEGIFAEGKLTSFSRVNQ